MWLVNRECGHPPRLTPDGHDELGDDRQDLGASAVQHVMDSLAGEEFIRKSSLS